MANASLATTQTLFTSLSNALNAGTVGGGGSSGGGGSTEAFRNLIINGSMIVDQRLEGGIIGINSNADYYICDRFFFKVSTVSVPSYLVQRVTVSDADNSITKQNFSIRAQATSNVNIGTSAGNTVGLFHNIEGAVATPLQWGTSSGRAATLSFYIKTNVTGTHWVTIKDALDYNSYVSTFNVPTADTYTRITQTIPSPPSNTVWMNDSNVGVKLSFDACEGNTPATSNNTWLFGNYTLPSSANSNMWGLSNTYIELAGIQLEVGSTATSFEYRPFSLERTLCQRYYEKSFPEGISPSPQYTARRLWFGNATGRGNTFFTRYTVGQSNDYNTLYDKYGQSNWMYFYVPSVSVYARLYWTNTTSSIVRQTIFSSSTDGVNWSANNSPSDIGIPYSGGATVPCDFYEITRDVSPQSAPGNAIYMMGSNSANPIPFSTTKRSIPTMTFYNPYSSNGNVATDTSYSSNLAVYMPNVNKFGVTSTESSLWNRNVYFNWAANSEFTTNSYYATLNVYNTGGPLTDFVVNYTLNYKNAFAANFQDLRFYDTTTNTLLTHWYESVVNSSNANVWLRIPSLVNGMKVGITVGNSSTSGNPSNIFPLYEDFSSLNTSSKWTSNGGFTSASNNFEFNSGNYTYLVTQSNYPGDFVLETVVRSSSGQAIPEFVLRGNISSNIGIKARADCRPGTNTGSYLNNPLVFPTWSILYQQNNFSFPPNNTNQSIRFSATGSNFEFYYNNSLLTTYANSSADLNSANGVVGIMNHNGQPVNFSWVRGYKSTSNIVSVTQF